MVRLVMKYFELSKLQVLQFVAGSPIYCGLSTPNQPTTQFIAACVEDGEWVLMGGPHNFLLSTHFYTIPHSSTLSPVRGYISRDPPPCLTDSFSCYLRFPVCSGHLPILSPAVRKDTLPQAPQAAFNGTFFSPRMHLWVSSYPGNGSNNEPSALWSMGVIGHRGSRSLMETPHCMEVIVPWVTRSLHLSCCLPATDLCQLQRYPVICKFGSRVCVDQHHRPYSTIVSSNTW